MYLPSCAGSAGLVQKLIPNSTTSNKTTLLFSWHFELDDKLPSSDFWIDAECALHPVQKEVPRAHNGHYVLLEVHVMWKN